MYLCSILRMSSLLHGIKQHESLRRARWHTRRTRKRYLVCNMFDYLVRLCRAVPPSPLARSRRTLNYRQDAKLSKGLGDGTPVTIKETVDMVEQRVYLTK